MGGEDFAAFVDVVVSVERVRPDRFETEEMNREYEEREKKRRERKGAGVFDEANGPSVTDNGQDGGVGNKERNRFGCEVDNTSVVETEDERSNWSQKNAWQLRAEHVGLTVECW